MKGTLGVTLNVSVGDGYENIYMQIDRERLDHHIEDIADNLAGGLRELIYTCYIKHMEKEDESNDGS